MLAIVTALLLCNAPSEVARVQEHLVGAERLMLKNTPPGLSPSQLQNRARNIERLREYRLRGVFPRNLDFAEKTPYFIDAFGTRCAMAHLIEQAGGGELVMKVARERNNAYVRELVDEPGLVEWLDVNGMTVDEAARVQPQYPPRCDNYRAALLCEHAPTSTVEVEVLPYLPDAGWGVKVVRVVRGQVDIPAGSLHAVEPNWANAQAGNHLFLIGPALSSDATGSTDSTLRFSQAELISPDGRIISEYDAECASPPSVSADQLGEALLLSLSSCEKQLEAIDPGYAQELCYPLGSPRANCGADGQLRGEVQPSLLKSCGCSSTTAASPAIALLLLLLARRQRQS